MVNKTLTYSPADGSAHHVVHNQQIGRFYVLKRMQDAYESFSKDEKAEVDTLLHACKMRELLDLKLNRDIGRARNLEVWM